MTNRTENLADGTCVQTRIQAVRLKNLAMVICLLATTIVGLPPVAGAADSKRSAAIKCVVTDGSGIAGYNGKTHSRRGSYSGETDGTRQDFSRWVFAGDGLDLRDRIDLFWDLSAKPRAVLRVAIDGPVSKPAHLLSITDDSVSAVVLTSDSDTTRTWLFTINFRKEQVMASGISSNIGGMKGQMIALTCKFDSQPDATALSSAADSWRRSGVPE